MVHNDWGCVYVGWVWFRPVQQSVLLEPHGSKNHQVTSQDNRLKLQWPELQEKLRDEPHRHSGGKVDENFTAYQTPMGALPTLETIAAPCHYWGITGPSVQLLSLPSPTNAHQNPTQAAKIFRGFCKTNFNNPFKCFFRIEHEFPKSRVAYSS